MIQNLYNLVFEYIGDYNRLENLKKVFKNIEDRHVNCLKINELTNINNLTKIEKIYLIKKYAKQLIILDCSYNQLT